MIRKRIALIPAAASLAFGATAHAHHSTAMFDFSKKIEISGTVKDFEITDELSKRPLEQAVPELVEMALKRGGPRCDNVTVLAMEWETPDEFQSTRVSTEDIEDGVFASTIQSGVPDPTIEDMDDEAIERSIAEINEAIRRTAEKNS